MHVCYHQRFSLIHVLRSASPLDAGWYGADVTCRIPFVARKSANSALVKHVPLFVTIVSGSPKQANNGRNSSITAAEVAECVQKASIHLHNLGATGPRGVPANSNGEAEREQVWLVTFDTRYTGEQQSLCQL